jgi:hypothetical protein
VWEIFDLIIEKDFCISENEFEMKNPIKKDENLWKDKNLLIWEENNEISFLEIRSTRFLFEFVNEENFDKKKKEKIDFEELRKEFVW